MNNKIIRTIGLFSDDPDPQATQRLKQLRDRALNMGFEVQTIRLIAKGMGIEELESRVSDEEVLLSVGTMSYEASIEMLDEFYRSGKVNFNVASTNPGLLFEVMKNKPEKTFSFAYVFNNVCSSPYFPSANYERNGFSVGLQATDLSEECESMEEYFKKLGQVWIELMSLFSDEEDFLGIDSSLAPLFEGKSSFVHMVRKYVGDFDAAVTTDFFVRVTNFIKESNPKMVGLSGLMLPALEDFELADEYEKGNFSIERNMFLSLHSGLGIDTYPIGMDESPERVGEILRLMHALSIKHNKPLSARFVSDGKANTGEKTDFGNHYLKDVVVRRL